MRSELQHLFALPRIAASLLISGVLLTILAVTALAGEEPRPPAEADDPALLFPVTNSSPSPAPSRPATRQPTGTSPAATTATEDVTAAPIAEEDEGAIEAPAAEAVEAARSEVSAGGRFSMPLAAWNRVTDRYGAPRGNGLVHGGIDLAVSGNVPVVAACGGVVSTAAYSSTYGNYVIVSCGEGWATLYGHFSALTVGAGDAVTRGTGLGYSGSTGYSTGEHLHFEVHYLGVRVNPEHYLDFKIPPGTPLSDGPITFPRNPYSGEPASSGGSSGTGSGSGSDGAPSPTPTDVPPTATPTVTNTPTPTATPTVTNTPTPTPTPSPLPPTPTPTPRPVLR